VCRNVGFLFVNPTDEAAIAYFFPSKRDRGFKLQWQGDDRCLLWVNAIAYIKFIRKINLQNGD
jgi:hypothetical protein